MYIKHLHITGWDALLRHLHFSSERMMNKVINRDSSNTSM